MKIIDNKLAYHEIDFLLPAQRFNINFSYITQKGLPFVRCRIPDDHMVACGTDVGEMRTTLSSSA